MSYAHVPVCACVCECVQSCQSYARAASHRCLLIARIMENYAHAMWRRRRRSGLELTSSSSSARSSQQAGDRLAFGRRGGQQQPHVAHTDNGHTRQQVHACACGWHAAQYRCRVFTHAHTQHTHTRTRTAGIKQRICSQIYAQLRAWCVCISRAFCFP